MDLKEQEKLLHREGFSRTYVWRDAPDTFHPEHTHPVETAHIILDGEISLVVEGRVQVCRAGDRCDVPARTVHSAKVGPRGCEYLIGERV